MEFKSLRIIKSESKCLWAKCVEGKFVMPFVALFVFNFFGSSLSWAINI